VKRNKTSTLSDDPLWYKDAIIYQVHIKSFFDANNDGIGDFPGLLAKLDYIAELGVDAIWLLPFYPSPRRDDGYDIADYRNVHPDYGTLADVKRFIQEAHARGIRVITELVINHTSDQHPWFQRARHAKPGSNHRNYYVWSDTDKKYEETRIIFIDTEPSNWTHDPVAGQYYWHRFYAHQPDLNFDNPAVRKAMLDCKDPRVAKGYAASRERPARRDRKASQVPRAKPVLPALLAPQHVGGRGRDGVRADRASASWATSRARGRP